MTALRTKVLRQKVSDMKAGRYRLSMVIAAIPALLLLGGCTGQMRPPSPITSHQRAELDKLAASKDAPEGLKEALAGIDANDKRHACQDRTAALAQQMKMLGMIDNAAMTAGKMGGRATVQAAKMVAVVHAKSIRTQASTLPNCADSAR